LSTQTFAFSLHDALPISKPCFRTAELNINIARTVIVAVLEKPDKASSVVTCVQLFKITKMTGTKSAIKAILIGSKNNKTIIPVTNKSMTIISISHLLIGKPSFRTAELNINIARTVIVAVLEKPDKASSVVTCVQLFKITKMTGTKSAIKAILIGSKNNKTIIPVTNKSMTIISISILLTLFIT